MTATRPDDETLKAFNDRIVDEFRANDGKVGGPSRAASCCSLTTTGAKSGQPRMSPLSCKRVDGKFLIIAGYRRRGRQPGLGVQPAGQPERARGTWPRSRST